MSNTVHQLKITLRGIRPPIWRRIEVPSDITLGELSPVFEAAMGWLGGHLHTFDIDGVTYGTPDPDWDTDELDEGEFRLRAVLPFVESKMRFDYDFGDGWVHNIVVEAINPNEAAVLYPRCLAGKRACPPEDCGGLPGYANILEVIADPNNPAHADLRDFVPLDYDPEHFDVVETDVDMRSERPLEGL
ncbi:MAG: plasmid pRiA4b ORF-3 family protein [Actinomycetia bacterium]|nr:plasmid pRiA4b ORF-3 family protein [Actinomycetes bacterium]